MKTKLLVFLFFLGISSVKAQPDIITNLTTYASGLDNPKDIKVVDSILYVATTTQLLSYDLKINNPTPNVVFTVPSSTTTSQSFVTTFNIRNGVALVVSEEINPVEDAFVDSKVNRIVLSNTSINNVIDTSANYVSAVIFDGNLLYRTIEIGEMSSLIVRDVSISGSTFTTLATFNGVVNDLAIFDDLVLVSHRDNRLSYVNVNDSSPSLLPLNIGTSSINSLGIQVLKEQLFFTNDNIIYEGSLFDEIVNIDEFELIENTTFETDNNEDSFSDIFIYRGIAYMTIMDRGLIVTAQIESDIECTNSNGTTFNDVLENLDSPSKLIIFNNEIYFDEPLVGISKLNLSSLVISPLYSAAKSGNNYEIIQDYALDSNHLYFNSITVDVSNFDHISSDIKRIDINGLNFAVETLVSSSVEAETIAGVTINNNELIYAVIDPNSDEDSTKIFTYDLDSNSSNDENVTLDFLIESSATNSDDIYLTDGEKIYKGDLNNLGANLTTFLDNSTDGGYIESISINNDNIYLSTGQNIEFISLSNTDPNATPSTIATNSSILQDIGYGTTACGLFEGIAVDGLKTYTSLTGSGKIVSFDTSSLSSNIINAKSSHFFSLNDKVLSFNDKNLNVSIYTITGNKVLDINTSESRELNLKNLESAIYIIKINSQSFKLVL
ncbi:T9SS type A sorting domain-containing protein [Wenyingzhuangia sp. IMCC45533]